MEGRLSRIPVYARLHRPEPPAGECGARRDTQGARLAGFSRGVQGGAGVRELHRCLAAWWLFQNLIRSFIPLFCLYLGLRLMLSLLCVPSAG